MELHIITHTGREYVLALFQNTHTHMLTHSRTRLQCTDEFWAIEVDAHRTCKPEHTHASTLYETAKMKWMRKKGSKQKINE